MNNSKIDFTQRNVGIDLLRALTMFVMIFVNDFWNIHDVPVWLEHSKAGVDFIGLADVVFPIFLFVVGMSIPYAIERRFSKGMSAESTMSHILTRTVALLVMGAFISNSEAGLSSNVGYSIGVYWILMVTGFILIWNLYPRTTDVNKKRLFTLLKVVGVLILVGLALTFRNADGGVFEARWGILGIIGWTYLLCAFIYLLVRDNLKYLIPIWGIFILICILGSRMNESWGGVPLLNLPAPNIYYEMLRILQIGNGAFAAFTMGGLIFSLVTAKYAKTAARKKAFYTVVAVAAFVFAGILSRQFWIVSKLSATPTWVFFVIAIAIGTYALLTWMVEKGKDHWLNVIKPAGTATLTCYLVPYLSYALANITGVVLPDWLTHGTMGIVNSLTFAFVIIGVTYLLGRIHIKLKI